jgi:DNA (cytosine-5)-methyltransferase 3A
MSCGRIALDRAGIPVTNYYASEIDKYAIQVARKNYPGTVHLGDVRDVMWPETFEGQRIDLLLGGSPCQGFSFAGKRLNFDDPRSKLFFEYVRILKEAQPRWFLLENVRMKQESQDIISDMLGVKPVAINSSLVSAQNRYRLYWTNIPFDMPADKGLVMRDILEDAPQDFTVMSDRFVERQKDVGPRLDAWRRLSTSRTEGKAITSGATEKPASPT